jgi:hypothetical protein
MAQALAEFRAPVGHEALRLRMAAMHGRDDALLDAGRFPRLLRQANDAEIADVRKVGEDEYEITANRSAPMLPPAPAPAVEEPAPELPPAAEPVAVGVTAETPVPGGKDNGIRSGVRFRRGSRGMLRAGEIPLIGLVEVEPAPGAAGAVQESAPLEATADAAPAKKSARPRRAPRKKAAAGAAVPEAPAAEGEAQPPAKRPRARARKKST